MGQVVRLLIFHLRVFYFSSSHIRLYVCRTPSRGIVTDECPVDTPLNTNEKHSIAPTVFRVASTYGVIPYVDRYAVDGIKGWGLPHPWFMWPKPLPT